VIDNGDITLNDASRWQPARFVYKNNFRVMSTGRRCTHIDSILQERNRSSKLGKNNRTVHVRYLCIKTAVLSCHRCLINTGVEKMYYI
jgi:hypothetical protein